MNEYRDRSTGVILSELEVRQTFPDKVLPQVLDANTLDDFGFDPVLASPMPSASPTQVVLRSGATLDGLGNWVYAWRVEDLSPDEIAANTERDNQAKRDAAKQARTEVVAAITVDVDGMTFDGDETSQGRMARAIIALEYAGQTSTLWVLSNNEAATVTVDQLRQALMKAGLAQTSLWLLPTL